MSEQTAIDREVEEKLRAVGQAFAARLAHDLPELEARARSILGAADEQQRLQGWRDVRNQLHRIAGAAGTFGFAALGERARLLEALADKYLDDPSGDSALARRMQQELALLAQKPLEPDQPERLAGSEAMRRRKDPDARHVWLVHDELAKAEGMAAALENFGYAVRHFGAMDALARALPGAEPDVLVIDIGVPGQEQAILDAAHALQDESAATLPLIVTGGRADDFASQLQAVRAGAVAYLKYPVDIPKLESRIERCFAQQHAEPYRVMIVDDDRELAQRYALVLQAANMLVEIIHEPSEALSGLRRFQPEVLLLDVQMPGCSGPELAQILRLNDDWLRVPIVYLSAETDITRQMAALLRAGDDFVTKPLSDNALIATVFAHAQRARLLGNALARDSLTGLLKHADIKERVAHEAARARRHGHAASVVMLDIDHFKKVNDTYGHAAGDNVIRTLANLLRQRLRRVDSLGRYGGEEFLAVLPHCKVEHAKQAIDQIRERFASLRFRAEGEEFSATLSAGIAPVDADSSAEALRERADQALYAAKHGGRNRVVLA